MSIKTVVGQVGLAGGDQRDRPSGVLVDEHTSRFGQGRRRGNLYALVEVSGQPSGRGTVTRTLLETVYNTYSGWRGSITAGLQQAIHDANGWLFAENRSSLPGELYTAGITCAVLRETDLFIAQAGPAVAYLVHKGQLSRFPDASPWLDNLPPDEAEATPLGTHRDASIALFHTEVDDDDTAILMETGLARRLSSQAWRAISTSSSVEEVQDALQMGARGSDFSAVVVAFSVAEPQLAAVQPKVQGAVPDDRAAAPFRASPAMTEGPRPAAAGRSILELVQFRLWPALQKAAHAVFTALIGLGAALLALLKRLVPGQVSTTPAVGKQPVAAPRTFREPVQRQRPAVTGRGSGRSVQRLLVWVAVAIPLIVATAVASVYVNRARDQKAELEGLWQKADASWQLAEQARDPASIRTNLVEAQQAVDELLRRQPEHSQAAALRIKILAWLDQVNQVHRVKLIGVLKTYPADANLTRVVVEGVQVFVLDRNAGKVYHHRLDSFQPALDSSTLDTVLVTKGEQVGNVLVGDLVDMAWVPVGEDRQKANLVILESNGALLEYDPSTEQLAPLIVAATASWQFPRLVGSYYGRFYVLDSTANKIWRYLPTPDGYSAAPDDWLKAEVDLLGVIDMAIGDSIYLLYNDGKIRKLTTGEPDRFDIADWDTPPNRPGAIFARPPDEAQWVYVADRGNNRIVRCSSAGAFDRQYRLTDSGEPGVSDPLAGVTSLFVDEIGGRAYFLSGQKLYMITLPE